MRLLAFDATPSNSLVNASWRVGAKLFQKHFDAVVPAISWHQIMNLCAKYEPKELHVWGHGAPGAPLIDREPASDRDPRWSSVGLVWFRSCNVMRGESGKVFVQNLTRMGVEVVGHTKIIGSRLGAHSGLYGLRPGDQPYWDPNPVATHSAPFAPRTVMFWEMDVPPWAFDPQKQLTS